MNHDYGMGFLVAALWAFGIDRREWSQRLLRWFRPNKVRSEYRKGIKQAKSVLRLIASTHYFEENLDDTILSFIPRADDHYHRAFTRHFRSRAWDLYRTQRAWAGAVKPAPTKASDW